MTVGAGSRPPEREAFILLRTVFSVAPVLFAAKVLR
jgi:hypothetical protein